MTKEELLTRLMSIDRQIGTRSWITAGGDLGELMDELREEINHEPSLPDDLNEAAEDFVWEVMENDEDGVSDLSRKLTPWSKISDFYDALAEFFKAGAEWAMQQLKGE